ncbi:hypothetical protein INT46_008608 [Mucor plumbeus]|uniref:Uncharacterized protein n=1 Tax=Mucor plumbeus TaxID=97098 RepID=A0A8H7V0A5_9FUNG|nr:hypothetical protein INT46_008608 [Mucor plumbeus]
MWGSNGNSFFWSDGDNNLLPHQIEPHVQGYVIDGSIDLSVYVDILEISLLDTLEDYFDLHIKDARFQQDRATSHISVITKQWFNEHSFSVDTIMNWPAQSPDLVCLV